MSTPPAATHEINLSEADGVRYLHFGTPWVQGAMRLEAPLAIELEYVRRMMAWLLFVDADAVPGRHAMQLGLGAGALTRFCHDTLGMRCTAVELSPRVVDACRAWFRLPPDDARLAVVLADAAQAIEEPGWQGSVDALAVDIYDEDAAAPVLDSRAHYAACRRLLTPTGCMTVNLFGRTLQFDQSLARIVEVFGARAVWRFRPTRSGNTVVLAQRTSSRPEARVLRERARDIKARWGLDARRWPRLLQVLEA